MTEEESRKRHFALKQYDVLQNGPEEEFEQLVELTCLLFSTPMAAITLMDGQDHRIKSQRGLAMHQSAPDMAFLSHTLGTGDTLVVEDARHDARFADHSTVTGPSGWRSYVGAPLCTPDGTRIGTICAIDTVARDFSQIDAEIMEHLARIAVANLELRLIASTDAASGADSRRAFMDTLGRELERHRRAGTRSTLLVCHIDGLDELATSDGPDAANAAIAHLAGQIRGCMRKSDTLGRVGYRALALLFADVGPDEADAAADRLRAAIEQTQNETPTVRFGYASAAANFPSAAAWIAAADEAARSEDPNWSRHDRASATHLGVGHRWMN